MCFLGFLYQFSLPNYSKNTFSCPGGYFFTKIIRNIRKNLFDFLPKINIFVQIEIKYSIYKNTQIFKKMTQSITLLLFLTGFVLLIKGADWLVDGASSIAKKYKISPIVIGLTIVAFGTSMPELVVNIFASLEGKTDIAIGNILGSNIANVFLILGISALINPLVAKRNTVIKEIPFSLLAALVVFFLANDLLLDGEKSSVITRSDGLILISFFIIFMYYTFGIARADTNTEDKKQIIKELSTPKSILFILLGLTGLIIGGKWIVDGAVVLAKMAGMSESVIGLTVVAIGTSLPELATSAMAAYKKQTDIAIGNVVGSNIFNLFWILGVSSIIKPLPFNPASNIDILMTIFASLVMFVGMYIGKRHTLEYKEGIGMISIYIFYLAYLIINGNGLLVS